MAKIVVTGVAGFMGSHLAEALIARGDEVIGIDNLIGGELDNVPPGVDFYHVDLSDLSEIEPLFAEANAVIHAACTAYEGLSVFSPALIVQNTMQITATVMSAAIQAKVDKIVYMSSMARYGEQEIVPFTEDLVPKPQDPYGISKLAAEKLVENLCQVHGMNYVIIVPHNIIGPRQKYNDPYRNVASIMINRMLQGKQPIIYGDGSQQRCFSFMSDVVSPLLLALDSEAVNSETINVGPDDEFVTINQLANEIAQLIDFELDPIYVPGRPQEVLQANCSANKARELLGYSPKTKLKQGLAELVEWVKTKGTREFEYHLPVEIVNELTPKTWVDHLI